MTWPVARNLGSTVLGVPDSDSAATIWWLDAVQAHGYRLTGSTVFDEVAVPFGHEQANALNVQWLWPLLPAFIWTKIVGAVAAYNVTLLTGFAFSGAAMYVFARRLGAAAAVAAWAGLAYLVFPWHVERAIAGHASLIHVECFPLLGLAILAVATRRSPGRLALLGAAVLCCWLSSGYYGVMALVVVPVALGAAALVATPRRRALTTALLATATSMAVTALVGIVALAGGGDGGVGGARDRQDLVQYGLRPIELVVPSPGSPLVRRVSPQWWETRKHDSNIQEVSNYLGVTTLVLALGWLVFAWRRRRRLSPAARASTVGASAVALVALALALPGRLQIAGVDWSWMPARVLWELVPAVRVPSRWTVVLFGATLVLATLGLQAVVTHVRRRYGGRRATALLAVVAAVTILELRVTHPGVYYDPAAMPPEYAFLAETPTGVLGEYPLVAGENSTSSAYLVRQRGHGWPLLTPGPGAGAKSEVEGVRRSLVDPMAPGVAASLAALGVTVVMTRPDTLARALEIELPAEAPTLGRGYRLVGSTPDRTSVWTVTAQPARAIAYLDARSFLTPTVDRSGQIVQPLRGARGKLAVLAVRPFDGTIELRLTSLDGVARRVSVGRSTAVVGPSAVTISIPVRLSRGRAEIAIVVDGLADDAVAIGASARLAS